VSLGLLWSAIISVFKSYFYAALCAMTFPECESAVMLFVIFPQLLKRCGAIHNSAWFPKALPFVVSSFPKALPLG
ncbi:MAG: hypothetical protein WCP85_17290, partial [Mariniphaga sp.]